MTCLIVGDTIEVKANTGQTGTVIRSGSLGTHSHVVEMDAGPLYAAGKKIVYYGNNGCAKITKTN